STTRYAAPRNELEAALAEIWQQLLAVERVGIHDNFFKLGGHSLLAARVISLIGKTLGAELLIKDLFLYPTLLELAAHLRLQKKGLRLPPITRETGPEHLPLSFSQERLWLTGQAQGSMPHPISRVLRLSGRLDKEALSAALRQTINRHEVLRTVIRAKGDGYCQQVMPADSWQMECIDAQVYRPFDLSADVLLRAQLIAVADQEHLLILVLHPIAADEGSCDILLRELAILYPALTILYPGDDPRAIDILPPLPIQYADYALWQRRRLADGLFSPALDYWRNELAGVTSFELPTDHARPAVRSVRGASLYLPLDPALLKAARDLARSSGATLFMTFLAAFKILLYRCSGEEDICVGTPVPGRQQPETEGLIGHFINILPLRSRVTADATFLSLLEEVKETTLKAYEHQDVPFEKPAEMGMNERDMPPAPIFRVLFGMQHGSRATEMRIGELVLSDESSGDTLVNFNLTLTISCGDNAPGCRIAYHTDLYKAETIRRLSSRYMRLLQSIIGAPDRRIAALEDDEEAKVAPLALSHE
ncbi:MAG TPA: condensation domain-containing protein, partial [Puia sp.]|nr:condensation domain-containing protein [Puia sp.]